MFEHLLNGFAVALQPMNLLIALVGCLVGTLIGVLPGLGPTATLAMLIPLVFSMPPATAMILLTSVYYGSMYGGSTTSILVNIPGESASVITCKDGNQMARQGRAGPALAISAIGSFIAGTFAVLVLTMVGAPVAGYALQLWPSGVLRPHDLRLVHGGEPDRHRCRQVRDHDLLRSHDRHGGHRPRLGRPPLSPSAIPFLQDGIDFVVVAIGMFAFTEVIVTAMEVREGTRAEIIKAERIWLSWEEFKYSLAVDFPRHRLRLHRRHAARRRCHAVHVHCLQPGKADLQEPRAAWYRRHPGRRQSRIRQQCRQRRIPGAPADAGHPRRRGHRGHAGRPDDAGHHSGTAAVREARGHGLGSDRQHVRGQRAAPHPQLAPRERVRPRDVGAGQVPDADRLGDLHHRGLVALLQFGGPACSPRAPACSATTSGGTSIPSSHSSWVSSSGGGWSRPTGRRSSSPREAI